MSTASACRSCPARTWPSSRPPASPRSSDPAPASARSRATSASTRAGAHRAPGVADLAELLRGAVAGERLPLARLLTAIENNAPGLRELLPSLFAVGRGAHLVGITGPPG